MASRRCAVLDENGVVINIILVDERAAGHYWPGYGAQLVDLGPAVNAQPASDKRLNFDPLFAGLEVLTVKVDGKPVALERGDRLDIRTGAVTKRPEPVVEVIEAPVEDGGR